MIQDLPTELHSLAMRSGSCSTEEEGKTVIKMIITRFPQTHLFLDGLDEECDNGERWRELEQVLEFFKDIPTVRIWCSSQDRACLSSLLKGFNPIELDKHLNGDDIKGCLSKRIWGLDTLELDEGFRTLIVADLVQKADGCFLWASLMLNSLASAHDLPHVQQIIQDELPDGYEDYYKQKLQSIKPSDRQLAW